MSAIGLIVLAAGGSTRLGTPKQLLRYQGNSLLRRATETACLSSCRPIVVVLGASAELCLTELKDLDVTAVVNTGWEEGMSSSIRVGVERLLPLASTSLNAVVLMLCDQPLLMPATLDTLVAEYRTSAPRIVASAYGETAGVPALFDHALFPELMSFTGVQGAKQILRRYPDQTRTVAFPEGAIDVDTVADFERLKDRRPFRGG